MLGILLEPAAIILLITFGSAGDDRVAFTETTNENINGRLRQYFPKGTDLSRWTAEEMQAVKQRSTAGLGRSSNGRPQRRPSMSTYGCSNKVVVLLPPVEPGKGADFRGRRITVGHAAVLSRVARRWAGVSQPRVLRGRSLSSVATSARCAAV